MAVFYRIVGAKWAAAAMDGEGARRFGGRWSPPGIAAVYLAESRALAALEIVVHAPRQALGVDWRLIEVVVPDDQIRVLARKPQDWRELPWSVGARRTGESFLRKNEKLALAVPSVVIPEEKNLLLNPLHPSAARLRVSKPKAFRFDPRVTG